MGKDYVDHWQHDDSAELAPRAPNLAQVEFQRLVQRAHLPTHPLGPAALVLMGIVYCIVLVHSFGHAHFGSRVETLTTLLVLGFASVPGLWMLIGGAWTLAETPLHFFQQRAVTHRRDV